MDSKEFRKDFLEDIKSEAMVVGEGSCAAFVDSFARNLVEAEVMPDFTPCFYLGTGKNLKKYRVDGYALDEYDGTMILVIADFDGHDERVLNRSNANQLFNRVVFFIDQAYNSALYKDIEMSTPCYDLIDILRNNRQRIRKFRLVIFTDAEISNVIKSFDLLEFEGIPIECQAWDIERMYRVCCSEIGKQSVEISFKKYMEYGIPCLEAGSARTMDYNCYLGIIPGKVLADIYDEYGSQLLEGNVRSFLSTKVAVNKKIRETIIRSPEMFFAYNNGVAATARNVVIESTEKGRYIVAAKDFQIINGGQTTASLSNTRHKDKVDLSSIFVQMKLTEIDETAEERSNDLIRNISKSSNSQNKVSDADFFATHPFHVRMEQFSRRIYAPATSGAQYETKWFYERARGQYFQAQMRLTIAKKKQFVLQNPKDKVITKTDLAKIRNTWSGYPQWVSKGAQTNFMKFAERVDELWSQGDIRFNERYFQETVALMILFRYTEQLIPKQSWYEQGYRANIVTYSIAMLRLLIKQQYRDRELDLQNIWNRQSIPEIISTVLEEITEAVFKKITDPSRETINVTQWCKRDSCWKSIQSISIELPSEIESVLIDIKDIKHAEKEAKEDQKLISGTEAQTKVIQISSEKWVEIHEFAKSKALLSPDEAKAIKYACQMPTVIPSAYQSQRLLGLLDRLMSEGYKI